MWHQSTRRALRSPTDEEYSMSDESSRLEYSHPPRVDDSISAKDVSSLTEEINEKACVR